MRDEKIKLYENLIAKCPRFERKGKTMPYTSANGHMFSQINKEGELGIRFSEEVQQQYIEKLGTGPFRSYGALMKGYVLIPEKMWDNLDVLVDMMNESYDYVMSLKPK